MNLKKLQSVNEFLTVQMNHWMLFPLALTTMGLTGSLTGQQKPDLLLWFICSLFPLFFYVLRCRIRHVFPLILLHFAVAALAFLIPTSNLVGRIIYVLSAMGYLVYSLFLQLKHHSPYSNPLNLVVGVALSAMTALLMHYQSDKDWQNYYTISLIISIALFFIIYYIRHYLDFLTVNNSSAGYLPAAEMFRSGMGLVLGYTLLGTIVLVITTHLQLISDILQVLKNLILQFLRFLFSLFPESESDVQTQIVEEAPDRSSQMMLPEVEETTFWLWEVLEYAMIVVLFAGLFYVIFKLVVKLIRLLQGRITHGSKSWDQDEEAFDLREKCDLEKNTERKKLNPFGVFSPGERIRKLYKKKLLSSTGRMSAQDSDRLGIYTAREWEAKLDTDGMAELYEQARYSGREMTGADVRRMREICRQQGR